MKVFILVAYVVMMVAIIFITAKKSLSIKGFLLGGYDVGPWMSALSYGTGYFSAVIIVGYSGSVGWNAGIAAVWCGIGNALIGSLIAWKLIAKPTRIMGEYLKVGTIPSFFEKRFNSRFLRILSAIIIFIFLIPYSASVYKGLGSIFKLSYGVDYTLAIIIIAIISSIYLFAGGYKATAITDFIQGIIMIVGILSVVFYIIKGAGGLTEGLNSLADPAIGGNGFNSLLGPKNSRTFLLTNVL
ncbi:MAG: sodium:solute symporter, partial [Christensenellaceae bacterium]|nr:sodium:solute symporter [Christensenellaceae bacterium]